MAIQKNKDKQPKIITGTTSTGFMYEIDARRLKNYELVEVLAEVEVKPQLFPRAIGLLLGEEQVQKLKEFVRDEEGFIDVERMVEEFRDIIESENDIKN